MSDDGMPIDDKTPVDSDELSMDDIEAAYLRALEASEAAETMLVAEPLSPTPSSADDVESSPTESSLNDVDDEDLSPELPEVQSRSVVEALLFVGGAPLTVRRISEILGGSHRHEDVDAIVADLNEQYSREGRPYEIRLVEGGYRLQLRNEFEPVRRRVYGQGPKEVRLSQDVLEALAFVAYKQPVTRRELEEAGKANAGSLLRQLLRRELISLHRDPEQGAEHYSTTPRFLQVFGLRSLDDLPTSGDFEFK